MLEAHSQRKYYPYLLSVFLLLAAGFVAIQLFTRPNWPLTAAVLLITAAALLAARFTRSIRLTDTHVHITYRRFFAEKQLAWPLSEVALTPSKASLRSRGRFVIIDIRRAGKRLYQVDSRDGFNPDELHRILDAANAR